MTVREPIILLVNGEQVLVQGKRQCLVRSKSFPGQWHAVEIDERNNAVCCCTGFTVRKACRHAATVRGWMLGTYTAKILNPEEVQNEADSLTPEDPSPVQAESD